MYAHISNNTRESQTQWTSERVHSATNNKGLHVDLRPPRLAQYVVIGREATGDVMTICEVEAFVGGMLVTGNKIISLL